MVSTTTFMEDAHKFISGLADKSFEDLVILGIVILAVGAVMKHRGGGGGRDGRGIFRMIGL